MSEPPGFREFVEARSPALLRTAWMLTGDAALAEELLQSALARTWPHRIRVARGGHPDAYVRKVMLRLNASWRSRLWSRERPVADVAPLQPATSHQEDARTVRPAPRGRLRCDGTFLCPHRVYCLKGR